MSRDCLIKSDIELMITYLSYAVETEKVRHIVVSGEIGLILSKLISKKIISIDVNLICVNGGLRKGIEPKGINIPLCQSFKAIFLDDSYYSGKTIRAVREYIEYINELAGSNCVLRRNYSIWYCKDYDF